MALVLADRVKETTTTTGTGTITLAGAVTGFQSFSAIGDGNTTYYTIAGQGTNEWEVGIGTYTASGTTLSRDTVLASSAGGTTKVTFSAGTKDVFVTYPAERSVYSDGTNIVPDSAAILGVLSGGTGQSSYTDGQLLIGNTTGNTLTKSTLTAGSGISITNGAGAITIAATASGGDYALRSYVAPATWTKPAGLKAIKVTVVGGGGAGFTIAPTPVNSGSGGGGGGSAIEYLPAPSIPGPVAVTAGAGTNSFGAFCSATAGGTGAGSPGGTPAPFGAAGLGGTGSGGTINMNGSPGMTGLISASATQYAGGPGGSSILGGGGRGAIGANAAASGGNYGGGGGGGTPSQPTGGAGAPGVVMIEEFY